MIMVCVGLFGLFGGGVEVSWFWLFTSPGSRLRLRWALANPWGTCMRPTWVLGAFLFVSWVFLVLGWVIDVSCVSGLFGSGVGLFWLCWLCSSGSCLCLRLH
jgi:hypothetical protein